MQDLIDIGFGYDESDPFIDNSEAVSIAGCICQSGPHLGHFAAKCTPFIWLMLSKTTGDTCPLSWLYFSSCNCLAFFLCSMCMFSPDIKHRVDRFTVSSVL